MFSDAHLHLTLPSPYGYEGTDMEKALKGAEAKGVALMVDLGVDLETSKGVVEKAKRYPEVWGAVGFHPWWVTRPIDDASYNALKALTRNSKVRFVGETGLDKNMNKENFELQKEVFRRLIKLAKEVNLPLNMHCGGAHKEMLEAMKAEGMPRRGGVIHDSSPKDVPTLKAYVELGSYISLGRSVLTPTPEVEEVIRSVPDEWMVLETDSYGQSYREHDFGPASLVNIAEKVARTRGVSPEKVGNTATNNLKRLMGVG